MSNRLPAVLLSVLALVAAGPGVAQYMYLDANGDGLDTSADVLTSASSGVDVWLNTSLGADGVSATCNSSGASLTINSYEYFVRATGTLVYGAWSDNMGFTTNFGDLQNTTDAYHGRGSGTVLAPGAHKLGRLALTGIVGGVTLSIVAGSPINPSGSTSFGSACEGSDFDNTYKLGRDWFDTAGCTLGGNQNSAPSAVILPTLLVDTGNIGSAEAEFSDFDSDSLDVTVENLPADLTAIPGPLVNGRRRLRLYSSRAASGARAESTDVTWRASDGMSSIGITSEIILAPPSTDSRDAGERISAVVLGNYAHGMPRSRVLEIGRPALSRLCEMLRDSRYQSYWCQVANAIGWLGDAAYFDTLKSFIWHRFQGEVPMPVYMAAVAAQASLGAMATTSSTVLEYVSAASAEGAWQDLPWRPQALSVRELQLSMEEASLTALAFADRPEAEQRLTSLESSGGDERRRREIRSAKELNEIVRRRGLIEGL